MLQKIKAYLNKGPERSSKAKKNIAALTLLKGISVLCALVNVPLTIDYVSSYEYGIWLTISSLITWLSFFDLGLGNGLRNKFIEAVQTGKHKLAKIYVSTAYAIISIIVTLVAVTAIAISWNLDWSRLLNAHADLESQLQWTIMIAIINFSMLFILGLNRSLLNAIQMPAIASMFDTASQVLLCLVLLVLTQFGNGSLVYLALAMGGTSIFVLLISNAWTFSHLLKQYKPSLKYVRFSMAKNIMSLGIMFFFLQIIAILFYQANNLIISHFVGPEEVTVYNIAYQYMQILTMIFNILITPFWSAYAEANVKGDYLWMKSTTSRLIKIVGMIALLGVVMIAVSPAFYKIWLQGKVEVPLIVTILVFGFHISNIWSTLWTQLLCGFGKIRLQLICSTLCCLTYLPMAIYGCQRFGLVGLLTASLISFVLFTSWFGIIQVRKLIGHTATGIWNR